MQEKDLRSKIEKTPFWCLFCFEKLNDLDTLVPKARSRKKVVATANSSECVYKRTGEPSVPFYEKGGTVKQVTDFLHKKIGTSVTCSDVAPQA